MTNPNEWLDLIAEHAERFRKAGVVRVEITETGCRFEIAPPNEPLELARVEGQSDEPVNPMKDPMTYGRLGRVPGYRRTRVED